jgi:hypothetical protein
LSVKYERQEQKEEQELTEAYPDPI